MTTFQSIIYGFLTGLLDPTPVRSDSAFLILKQFFHWSAPAGFEKGILLLGVALALLIYFRHEWVAMLAGMVRVLAFREKPQSLDERTPFILLASWLPVFVAKLFLKGPLEEWGGLPLKFLLVFEIALGVVLFLTGNPARKNKALYHLQWFHVPVIIFFNLIGIVLLGETFSLGLLAFFLMGFSIETGGKFSLYFLTLNLFASLSSLFAEGRLPETSTLSCVVAGFIALGGTLMSINGLCQQFERKNLNYYFILKSVLAAVALGVLFFAGQL